MGLMLGFHGGLCCGIKVIHGFGYWDGPDAAEPALKKKFPIDLDQHGRNFRTTTSFFTDAAPQEPRLQRFDRYIKFCEKHRPNGIIEATLIPQQVTVWEKIFEERGFREVNKCKNSNSGNTVHVFHKNSGE